MSTQERQFRPAGDPLPVSDDEVLEAAGLRSQEAVAAVVSGETVAGEVKRKRGRQTVERRARMASEVKMQSKSLVLPKYVWDQLRVRAAKNDCSMRFLIMKGLRTAQIQIDDEDMNEDRRRPKKR